MIDIAELTPMGTLTAEELGTVHLIGVGGVGMSGLARLLLTRGIRVTGSELRQWPALAGLRALGGTIHTTHQPSNLDGVDTVVYSTAIPADRSPGDRGGRYPRQDHHHLDGHADPPARQPGPVVRDRR